MKQVKSILILLSVFYLFQLSLNAAYLTDVAMEVVQPDKTIVNCLASGDEYHHWLHDADGYTIVQSPTTGFYAYAKREGANLVPSNLIAGRDNPRSGGLVPRLNISREQYLSKRSAVEAINPLRDSPTTGTFNNLVIYIKFSTQTDFDLLTSSQDTFYNATGPDVLSVQSYFFEESYGQLNVVTHFLPTQTGTTIVSYQDPHPRSYYSPYNELSNPDGYTPDNVGTRVAALRSAAANYVNSMVPVGVDFDMDNDGILDNLVFYFRGSPDGWGELLWPKMGNMQWQNVSLGGSIIGTYNFAFQTMAGLNVQCHEFTHTLGAPDLYHYEEDGGYPVGPWDIMAGGGAHCSSYLKWHYIGWIADIPVISSPGTYTLNPLTSSTGNAYRINSPNPDEYFLLEYRRNIGRYEGGLPGSGLLIYRVNTLLNSNAGGPPDVLYVNRPGYSSLSDGRVSDAHFSQEVGRTIFNDSTNPYCFLSNGDSGEINIQNIGSAGETISFYYGPRSIDFEVNPDLQTFEGLYFTPSGWTNQAVIGGGTFTRIEDGLTPVCEPQFGKTMLQYNSNNLPAGNSAMLGSPKVSIQHHTTAKYGISFWMYREANNLSANDRIEVYRNATQNLSGTPVLIGTVNRSTSLAPSVSEEGWYQYSFLLNQPANGEYYIILKAISALGGNIYLDDVALSRHCYTSVANHSPANNSTNVSIDPVLSWQNYGGDPEGYRISLGTDNPPSSVFYNILLENVNTYTLGTLCANTRYYWQVSPYGPLGVGFSPPIMSFTTAALSAMNPPYLEDYDDSPIPALPPGWRIVNANNDAYDSRTQVSSSGPGKQMVMYASYNGPDLDDWAISRGINLSGGQSYRVSFKYRKYGNVGTAKLAFFYGASSSHLEAHTQLYQNETITSTAFQLCELSFIPPSSGVYYFKFYGYSAIIPGSFNFPGISIDDFSISGIISAALSNPSPAAGAGSVAIDTSFSWELASGSPTGYYLSLGTDNPPTNLAYRLDLGSAMSWTPPTPLAYNKPYFWRVIPYTVSGEVQDSPIWQFFSQSDQVASQMPFGENFDSVTVPAIPAGWTQTNLHQTGSLYWKTSDLVYYSAPNGIRIHRQFTQNDDIWLMSPALRLYASTSYQLRFKWRSDSSTSFPEKLQIAIGNAPEAAYMTQQIYNNDNMKSASYRQVVIDFDTDSTGDYYLGFQSYSEATPWDHYLNLDDIEVLCLDEPSPVFNPSPADAASGIYVNAGTLDWEHNGDLGGFKINLGTDNPPTNILYNVDLGLISSCVYPALWEFGTTYYWQIVPFNSVGDCIEPTIFSFTTMPAGTIANYPYFEDFQAVTAPLFPDGYFSEDANEDGNTWFSHDASGAKTLRATAGSTVSGDDWLFLPKLEIETGAYYLLEFLYRQTTPHKTGKLSVYYGTDPVPSAMTNLLFEDYSIISLPIYLLAQEAFIGPAVASLYIGFYFWSDLGQGTISVDDISIKELSAPILSPTPADNAMGVHRNPLFSWSEPAGNPDGYRLYIGTDNPPTNLVNAQDLGLVNELHLTELLYVDTDYYWRVVPYNSNGLTPDCPIFTFHTMLETTILSLPYNQNFDALETPALPYDWQINDANEDGITWHSSSVMPRSAPNNVRIVSSAQHMNDWMFMPPMYFEQGIEYRLSFYYRRSSVSNTERLKVYYGSSASPTGMNYQLLNFTLSGITGYSSTQVSFTPVESAAYYLGFKGDSSANQGIIMLDDISVQRLTALPKPPRSLAAQAPGTNVNLTWQAPIGAGQSSYKLYRDGLVIASIPGEQTSWTDLQVDLGHTYTYYLTALYSSPDLQSEPSNYAYATLVDPGIPLAPATLRIQHIGTAIVINWQPVLMDDLGNPITISEYQIHASDSPDFTPSSATLLYTTTQNTYQETVFYPRRFYRIIAIRPDRS